mgnify:CR=1 FL=1
MIEQDWLAEVAAPIPGKNASKISTGAPISRRLLLTTGHGVPQEKDQEIKIRFIRDFREGRDWRTAQTIWHGKKYGIDAALLEFDTIKELDSFIYTGMRPVNPVEWYGAGFAAAGKITEGELAGYRDAPGLVGKLNPMGNPKTDLLDLTVEAKPVKPKLWAGISGAPVIFHGQLIGIIQSLDEDFGGDRLNAMPMQRLLEIPEFCKLIVFEDREDLVKSSRHDLVNTLKESEEAMTALHAQKALKNIVKGAETIIDALFKMDLETFSITLRGAIRNPCVKSSASANVLFDTLDRMLPILYDASTIASVKTQIGEFNFIRLPVHTHTIAEIIMAGVDRRPVKFKKPVKGTEHPVGTFNIDSQPETGFDLQNEAAITDVENHLAKKLLPESDFAVRKETLHTLINEELEYRSENNDEGGEALRHYFIYREDAVRDDLVASLKRIFHQIKFIAITGTEASLIEERRISRPLRDAYERRRDEKK